ncbi:CPBP family intramembrane glutamic endopeptidase [Clostridium oceanicum]|uniref:CPBP family intramembrane metalloprotease n=1 Tax=Clostridium oceanicum TaxID=1543 RepID=A0ABN1J8Q0_9CLOT
MDIHIQCLNAIILFFSLNPIILAQTALYRKPKDKYTFIDFLKILSIIYIFICICIWIIMPYNFKFNLPREGYWYWISGGAVFVSFFIEVIISYITLWIKGKTIKGLKVSFCFQKSSFKAISITIAIAIFEEFIYRQVWFNILLKDFRLNIILVLIITSFVYSLNHMYLGKIVVFQKFSSGLIYGCLFYFSSGSIIIPIITHCIQNVIILMKGRQ